MPTVLCTDDSREGLATNKCFLETKGFSQTGLDVMACNQIHAVALDYRMSGLSGEDVARKIKPRWPSVPINTLSGYPVVPESAKNLADSFVVKVTLKISCTQSLTGLSDFDLYQKQ